MRRRKFLTLIGSAAAAWPLAARAQQSASPAIGYLSNGTSVGFAPMVAAFRRGLNETGYIEGRNYTIEFRWAEGHEERLPELAADLIRHPASLIAATGGSAPALAAKAATMTIPIVFTGGQDPVQLGLVESLGRPGGNATGVINIAPALAAKRLELLHELVPTVSVIAVLLNAGAMGSDEQAAELETAASRLGKSIRVFKASSEDDFAPAFDAMARQGIGALYVIADPFFTSRAARLVALAAQYAIPASYSFPTFAEAGGLMTYGANLADQHRQAGVYAGRILKGAKPADLPVLQPTKFDLAINLKTAKALGLTVPQGLLVAADQVIE
jgi:putative tryptophan/tyrosine transport system substrate-binding protein